MIMSLPQTPRKVPRPNCFILDTYIDPKKQIPRGEAIRIDGLWFRFSSAAKAGVSLHEQPVRAQAPSYVVSLQDFSIRNDVDGYIRTIRWQLSKSSVHSVVISTCCK